MSATKISEAIPCLEHAQAIKDMIEELAAYEKMPGRCQLSSDDLKQSLQNGHFIAYLAERNGKFVGYLLAYYAYSTWNGRFFHMEDLYVRPESRNKGIGKALWRKLAQRAKAEKHVRLQWNVLDWNTPAIDFYKTMGAIDLGGKEGWLTYRLEEKALQQLADTPSNVKELESY